MDLLWKLAATAGLLAVAVPVLCKARPALRTTTLTAAWGWLAVGIAVWTFSWTATVLTSAMSPALADQLWYMTAVLMLCPLVAALGAKRPGARVWAWFVLLPLVLVLGVPALSAWGRDWQVARLHLEVPAVIGFTLVLVMGAGNYVGTRFTLAAGLYAAALVLVVAPFSSAVPDAFPPAERARLWATLCLGGSLAAAARRAARPIVGEPFERLWSDVRDWFGIVWAKRLLERVNDTAVRESWPLRLDMQGLVWTGDPDAAARERTLARLDHTLRWLLRRFVDAEWIDRRLDPEQTWSSVTPQVDSQHVLRTTELATAAGCVCETRAADDTKSEDRN